MSVEAQDASQVRGQIINIRASEAEKAEVFADAAKAGMDVSAWTRFCWRTGKNLGRATTTPVIPRGPEITMRPAVQTGPISTGSASAGGASPPPPDGASVGGLDASMHPGTMPDGKAGSTLPTAAQLARLARVPIAVANRWHNRATSILAEDGLTEAIVYLESVSGVDV